LAIERLLGRVNAIQSVIYDIEEKLTAMTIAVGVEKKYFDRVRKRNDTAAYYQRQRRQEARLGKEPVADTTLDFTPAAYTPTLHITAEEARAQQEMRDRNAERARYEEYKKEAAERKRLRDLAASTPLPSPEGARAGDVHHEQGADAGADAGAEGPANSAEATEDIVKTLIEEGNNKSAAAGAASASGAEASEAPSPSQPAPVSSLTGPSYDPSVVATSVPSLEELNKTPFAPGASLF
jgi:hypothetical protein